MSDIQVWVRVVCPRSDCEDGKVYAPMIHAGIKLAPPLERDCDYCDGKGHVEEWRDLAALVGEVVNIG